jgi:hypothetical protein
LKRFVIDAARSGSVGPSGYVGAGGNSYPTWFRAAAVSGGGTSTASLEGGGTGVVVDAGCSETSGDGVSSAVSGAEDAVHAAATRAKDNANTSTGDLAISASYECGVSS